MALTVKQALAGGKIQVTLCVTVCSVAVVIILQCATAEQGNKPEPSGWIYSSTKGSTDQNSFLSCALVSLRIAVSFIIRSLMLP